MDYARFQQVETLFHAALEVDASKRDALLRERCADDDALRNEVEALLAAHGMSGAFIESAVATLERHLLEHDDEADRLVGETIGRWEILKRIGAGGMGSVYLARRADRQYEQQVAIKLIKRGMDTASMLRRFRNERQILASLDHPNIARLLDGDTTADGRPYFVMEYVEGLPIDEYCDQQALDVNRRLDLFCQVCSAVSHAHRHAVIHRDLKTSNILVAADGVPKLLDFGIARLLQADDAAEAPVTLLEQRVMTPEYASPEHLRGELVTTASDVYSLGVVLFRLLTGQLPYRLSALSTDEIAREVGKTEPQRPSAVSDAALRRQLRGDLDNIVLMALRKEPERRYPTVEQFSEDIRRHLESRPVLARRDTLAYRAGKFIRRNTALSISAALVVLSLVGGIVLTTWQAQRAQAEKARAEHRFDEVRRLARSVIFDYHDAIKDLSGATAIRERLVKDGLAYLDSLASEAGNDPELQRELAAAYDRVGDVRGEAYSAASLGDLAGATESYTKALRIREALVATTPGDFESRLDLAYSYRKIGVQLLETTESARGLEYLQKGLMAYERLATYQPESPEIRQELANTHNSLGLAMEGAGNLAGAVDNHRKALALREALAALDPTNQALRRSVVISDINLGRALFLSGDSAGALASNRKALAICEALVAENPSSADFRRLLANTYQNNGDYLAFLGDVEGALQSFRRKLPFDEQALAEDSHNAVARLDRAYTLERLGDLLADHGKHGEALSNYRAALGDHESIGSESSEDLYLRFRAIMVHGGIGATQARLAGHSAALAAFSRAMELLEGIAADPANGSRSSLRGQVYMRVAAGYAALGDSAALGTGARRGHWGTARDLYLQSQEIWQEMQRRGILTADDRTKPEEVARGIARCNASLQRL